MIILNIKHEAGDIIEGEASTNRENEKKRIIFKNEIKGKPEIFTWSVRFNEPLNASTVNKATAFIVNSVAHRMNANVNYSPDDQLLNISVEEKYIESEPYFLILTPYIKSSLGSRIRKTNIIRFIIESGKVSMKIMNPDTEESLSLLQRVSYTNGIKGLYDEKKLKKKK